MAPGGVAFNCRRLWKKKKKMGGEGQILKRIPRIKFPQRHPKSSASGQSQLENSANKDMNHVSFSSSNVRPLPRNTSVGGKATLQPKRMPLSDEEIEAILLGECI